MISYHFKINQWPDGFTAECIEIPGCRTEGDNLDDLHTNMKEVLDLCLDEPSDSTLIFREPKNYRRLPANVIAVEADPRIVLAQKIRQARIQAGLSQLQAAKRLDFKAVSQYQKLEKKPNPTLETLMKLKGIFPDLSLNDLF